MTPENATTATQRSTVILIFMPEIKHLTPAG
jgi:hypothetical protein